MCFLSIRRRHTSCALVTGVRRVLFRSPDLGRYTVPIMNYNIATAPLANAYTLLPSDAAVADSRFVLNYFRLSADKRLIFGGGERYSQTRSEERRGGEACGCTCRYRWSLYH